MNKVALFLMGHKGLKVLEHTISHFPQVIEKVVSSRDLKIQKDYFSEIRDLCISHSIKFYDRKEKDVVSNFSCYSIAISWRWLINIDNHKLIVLHDSLLPKYRGFNPLVTALINEDTEIGVTALLASKDYDRGKILSQASTNIKYPISIQEAIEKISVCYVELVHLILNNLANQNFMSGKEQDERIATYSLWRNKDDYKVDWTRDSQYIKRFVDAVGFPYAGASTLVNDKDEIRVLQVTVVEDVFVEDRKAHVGKVIFMRDGKPVIVCGKGLIQIENMQDESGSEYLFTQFRTKLK